MLREFFWVGFFLFCLFFFCKRFLKKKTKQNTYLFIHADFELFRFPSENMSMSDEPGSSSLVDLQIIDSGTQGRVWSVIVYRTTHEKSGKETQNVWKSRSCITPSTFSNRLGHITNQFSNRIISFIHNIASLCIAYRTLKWIVGHPSLKPQSSDISANVQGIQIVWSVRLQYTVESRYNGYQGINKIYPL